MESRIPELVDHTNQGLLKFVTAENNNLNGRLEQALLNYYNFGDNFSENLNNELEENYRCKKCQKSFKYKTSFLQHDCEIASERRFQCKECGKLLARKSSLVGHMRIHTGEKPFLCKLCGKAFTHKHHLHSHMLTHRE